MNFRLFILREMFFFFLSINNDNFLKIPYDINIYNYKEFDGK